MVTSMPDVDLWQLSDLETPWSLFVVCTLRVAEHIAAGASQIDDLSARTGADAESLQRVLRHLVRRGVFEEPSPGTFALNDAARKLMDPSLRLGLDLNGIGGRMADAWGTLLTAVRTGAPAYHLRFGQPFWEDLRDHPEVSSTFDDLMSPL